MNLKTNKLLIKKITIIAAFAALAVIFRLFTLYVLGESSRVVIYNIPIMLAGLVYGPLGGITVAVVADFSAILVEPNWNPFFMIPAAMWGLVPGLFRYFGNYRDVRFLSVIEIVTHILVTVINSLLIGTLFVGNLGLTFWSARLATALPIMIIKIPVDIIILHVIIKRVIDPLINKKRYNYNGD